MSRERSRGMFRFSGQQLLATLVLFLVAFPFLEQWRWGDYAASVLFSLILLSSVLAVGDRRGVFIAGLLLTIPAVAFRWSSHFTTLDEEAPVLLVTMSLAVGFTILQLLRFV